MKGRKCHVRGRRYAEDRECHVADVDSAPQQPNRRLYRPPNRLLRHKKRHSRVLDPSIDRRIGALGQQPDIEADVGGERWEKPTSDFHGGGGNWNGTMG